MVDFNAGLITLAPLCENGWVCSSEKSYFKILGLTFFSKYIISIIETASKKIGDLIHSIKFFSHEVALYLYKSTIWLCMEYCCLVLAGTPS